MSDYIKMEGAFVSACESLANKGIHLPWLDSHLSVTPDRMADKRDQLVNSGVAFVGGEAPIAKAISAGIKLELTAPSQRVAKQRIRQICPQCQIRAWTEPGVAITCGACDEPMEEQ